MSAEGTGSSPGRGEISPEDRAALKKRADELGKRLDEVKERSAKASAPREDAAERGNAMGQAFKIAAELVAGVGFGGFVGWALDRQFGTAPWLFVVFLILGFAAGMLNVIRTARQMQARAEPLQRSAPSVKDADDEDGR